LHSEAWDFLLSVKRKHPHMFEGRKVLDCGSLDINGSNRSLFTGCEYDGIDVGEGKNVDIVSLIHEWDLPSMSYETIICTEVFQHDPFFELSLSNMYRLLRSRGLLIFTCATAGRAECGTTHHHPGTNPLGLLRGDMRNHYKNITVEDVYRVFKIGHQENKHQRPISWETLFSSHDLIIHNHDLYFWGVKS